MGTPRFTPRFKEEAVRQMMEHGYSVVEGLATTNSSL